MRIFSLTLDGFTTEKQFGASQQVSWLGDDRENIIFVNTLQISWQSGIIFAI